MELLTPQIPNFRGLYFLLIIPSEKLVLAVQLKYENSLYKKWKKFMNPPPETTSPADETPQEAQDAVDETPEEDQEEDQDAADETPEEAQDAAENKKNTKEALKSYCKENGYKVAFTLMYLIERKINYENVKKLLGAEDTIYLWRAAELDILMNY